MCFAFSVRRGHPSALFYFLLGLLLGACQAQSNPTPSILSPTALPPAAPSVPPIPQPSPSVTPPFDPDREIVVTPTTTPLPPMRWERRDTGIPAYTFVTGFIEDEAGWWVGAYDDTGLWFSPDKGETWETVGAFAGPVFAVAQTDGIKWVAASGGLWRGDASGWQRVEGLPDEEVLDLTTDGKTVYAALGLGGLWKIEGERATAISIPPESLIPTAGALSIAAKGDWLLLGTSGAGVWQSFDGGATWEQFRFDERAFSANLIIADEQRAWVQNHNGLWYTATRGQSWEKWSDEEFTATYYDGTSIIVGSKTGIVQRSADGITWQPVGSGLNPRLPVVTLTQNTDGALMAGMQDGLWRLEGDRWVQQGSFGQKTINALAKRPNGVLLVGHRDGVYRSTDDGQTWQLSPLGGATVLTFALTGDRIYAGTDGLGVWHSSDQGATWTRLQGGADISLITGLYPDPTNANRLYAQVAYDRLYVWESAAQGWQATWEGIHVESEVFDVEQDIYTPNRMWAGTTDGLVTWNVTEKQWSYLAPELQDQTVLSVEYQSPLNKLLLGSTRGLYYVDLASNEVTRSPAAPMASINQISRTEGYRRWLFGTPFEGLYSLTEGTLWQKEAIEGDAVSAIVPTDDGVYVATDAGLWYSEDYTEDGDGVWYPSFGESVAEVASVPTPVATATPTESTDPRLYAHLLNPSDTLFKLAADSGFTGVVILLPWRDIEPNPNEWHWERADAWLYAAQYYGLDIVIRLDQSPAWATATPDIPFDSLNPLPTRWNDYADYAAHVARRYQGRVKGYILWNEPNLAIDWGSQSPDPQGYINLLSTTTPILRDIDPSALIIGGALAPTTRNDDVAMDDLLYLEALLQQGAVDYFDVLAVHPYPFGLSPSAPANSNDGLNLARLQQVEALLGEYGQGDMPVWATEFGYSTANSLFGNAVTAEQRRAYLKESIEVFRNAYPGVQVLTLWNLAEELPDGDEKAGYNLKDDTAALSLVRGNTPATSSTASAPLPVALAADVKVHLGDSELPPPWWPLFQGRSPSTVWENGFYLAEVPTTTVTLSLELFQPNELGNTLSLNGITLHTSPMPVADFRSQWLTLNLIVPSQQLRTGWNTATYQIGHIVPNFQQRRYVWDDLQVRNVRLTEVMP